MRTLTRWNPFKEMDEFQSRLSAVLNGLGNWAAVQRPADRKESLAASDWSPLVDIAEKGDGYELKLDLPEVRKEDLKVTVENGVLIITGERRFEKEDQGTKYHRVERAYGSFARSFTLPDNADPSKVNAEFKDGLLKVRIVKDEKAKPKAIDVRVV